MSSLFRTFSPTRADGPSTWTAKTIGGIAASGAKSEIDEAVAQAALDALFKK
jgi:glc operon protein GlcG